MSSIFFCARCTHPSRTMENSRQPQAMKAIVHMRSCSDVHWCCICGVAPTSSSSRFSKTVTTRCCCGCCCQRPATAMRTCRPAAFKTYLDALPVLRHVCEDAAALLKHLRHHAPRARDMAHHCSLFIHCIPYLPAHLCPRKQLLPVCCLALPRNLPAGEHGRSTVCALAVLVAARSGT